MILLLVDNHLICLINSIALENVGLRNLLQNLELSIIISIFAP